MLNHSVIMGRFVRDPEIRRTNSGKAVVSFTLAVDKPGKDSGASFIPFVAWEKTGEFISKYFTKGSAIIVESRVDSRDYETKDGQKRTVIELVVQQAHFCEKKKEEKSDGFSAGEPTYQQNNFTLLDDNEPLPF